MSFIDWKDSMSVEIEQIDTQHMQLVSLINDLYSAMSKGKGKEQLNGIFKELMDYAKIHFFEEEKLMIVHGYDGYEQHKSEHEKFVQEVKKLKDEFDKGESKISIEVAKFLKDWLIHHIMKTDQQYAPYLQKRIR